MNGITLLMATWLLAGCDEPRHKFSLIATPEQRPATNRGIADIASKVDPGPDRPFAIIDVGVDEAPTGRILFSPGRLAPSPVRTPDVERRLDEMERKLDLILKTLEGLKARP